MKKHPLLQGTVNVDTKRLKFSHVIEGKKVTASGNGAAVTIPKKHIGRNCIVFILGRKK